MAADGSASPRVMSKPFVVHPNATELGNEVENHFQEMYFLYLDFVCQGQSYPLSIFLLTLWPSRYINLGWCYYLIQGNEVNEMGRLIF